MKSLLIKDTTVSERAQIVREALGGDADCVIGRVATLARARRH